MLSKRNFLIDMELCRFGGAVHRLCPLARNTIRGAGQDSGTR